MFHHQDSNLILIGFWLVIGILNPGFVITHTLLKRERDDCDGSSSCGLVEIKYCDQAVNNLIRNDDFTYGSSGYVLHFSLKLLLTFLRFVSDLFNLHLLHPHTSYIYNYISRSGKSESGNCWANAFGNGCGVFVQGPDNNGNPCVSTGNSLWYDYQDLRKLGGCSKCGSKHHDNGCLTTVNYVTGCKNRG